MKSIEDYFERIYCINLLKRKDRWDDFTKEMKRINVENYERYNAVDGKLIKNNTNLLSGELGVLNTHISLIKKLKSGDIVVTKCRILTIGEHISRMASYIFLKKESRPLKFWVWCELRLLSVSFNFPLS